MEELVLGGGVEVGGVCVVGVFWMFLEWGEEGGGEGVVSEVVVGCRLDKGGCLEECLGGW